MVEKVENNKQNVQTNTKPFWKFLKGLSVPVVAGIVAGLVAGWVLNYYQIKDDIKRVKSAIRAEIETNLPLLEEYLDELGKYNPRTKDAEDIYKLQNKKFQTIAFKSISNNVSLLDREIIINIYRLYHTYDLIEDIIPYNLTPIQDKPIQESIHQLGETVWRANVNRVNEILSEKKKLLESAINVSKTILKNL